MAANEKLKGAQVNLILRPFWGTLDRSIRETAW